MIYKVILFLLAFNSIIAYAKDDQILTDIGVGLFNTGTQSKELGAGIQEDIWETVKQRGIIGGFIDPNTGRSSAGYVFGQLGLEVENGVVVSVFSGPGLISNHDSLLGSYVQIMSDAHLGIEDKENNYIGLMYKNISLVGPSSRNYMGLEIRFPI